MPTFELSGPDGGTYSLDAPDEAAALSAFSTLHGGAAPAAPGEGVSTNKVVRAAATGVPIVGGALNKMNAATNAALAPVVEPFLERGPETLDQPTFGERYAKSLELQEQADKSFAEQHPVVDTAAKLAGGIGGMIPAVRAAPAVFGAIGTLPQMVTRGAVSGGALGGLDAAVRGEDVGTGAGVGTVMGAGAPFVGRAIGATARGIKSLRGGAAPPVHQNTIDVNGVPVPVTEGQIVRSPAQQAEEQIILNGGRGEKAQQLALEAKANQEAALGRANETISAGLDPTGAAPATTPHAAGASVLDELTAAEQTRFQTEQAARQRAAAEGERLRMGLGAGGPAVDSPAGAGEALSGAVAQRNRAAKAGVEAAYEEQNAAPGTFDPSVPRTMAEEIRARVNRGDDPLWVDPETSGVANEALRLIDKTIGSQSAIFHNAAASPAPVGPVAEAAAASAGKSDAQRAHDALTGMGVHPERARAAVADLPGGDVVGGVMTPHSVAVPSGGSVKVAPKVVEASSIKTSADPGYDPTLQPRNRARAASDAQINDIAKNLNPERLGRSGEADRGAPIIGPDGMVESGNGRVLAVRKAYEESGPAAQRYRDWLAGQGADISGFKEPVLVRERTTPMSSDERKAFTVAANQSSTLSLSAPERALADARTLKPETLSLIRNPSDLGAVENRDFVRAFMQGVPASERGALMTASGDLSSEGLTRIRNAVLGKAYGDTPILSRIAESTNDDVRSISNALTAAAPEWARLRAGVASGAIPAELDATPHLLDAVNRTARIRGKGVGLADSQAQADAFAAQSPESQAFQRLFYDADGAKAAPGARIADALRHYAQEASKVDASPGLGLGLPPVTAADVLKGTAARVGAPAELAASVREAAAAPAAEAAAQPIGLRELDSARKRLNTMLGDALSKARAPGGSFTDVRAVQRIIREFDNVVKDALASGKFSGDPVEAQRLMDAARAAHSEYARTFRSRGAGDDIGRAVEKILGRFTDTAAGPDEIAKLSYGSVASPGGSAAARVAQRLKSIVGPTSPEWGAYKQGLVSHLVDAPEGKVWSPAEKATRIDKYLRDPHAQVALSGEERTALKSYADNLRLTEPVPLSSLNTVDKAIARLSGRDGGPPATTRDAVDMLFGDSRLGTGNKISVPLVQRLKRDLSPDAFNRVRQGAWSRLTDAGEGKIPFEAQALSQRLNEFLSGKGQDLAKSLFTAEERRQMQVLANAYKQMIPLKGTTNPSGTAAALTRLANKASHNVLAMLGGIHGGFMGAAVGLGVEKGARSIGNARNAKAAVRSFYGVQPRIGVKPSTAPQALFQGAVPSMSERRR